MLRRSAALLAGRAGRLASNAEAQAARGVSSSASAWAAPPNDKEDLNAPSTQGIQGRYATALFAASKKAGALDAVDKDLVQIRTLAASSPAFAAFLKDRSVPKKAKGAQLESILADLKVNELTKNFFAVLADNNRLGEAGKIFDTFGELVAHARGQVTAFVTTADPLSAEEADEIRKGLGDVLPKGKALTLVQRVDPAIIGGVVIDVGDKHIDLSIASRIKQVQNLIQSGLGV